MISDLPAKLTSVRCGVSFAECLGSSSRNAELVANYDRLRGTNLSQKGSGLDLAIDQASGRMETELEGFIEFVWEFIFLRFGN